MNEEKTRLREEERMALESIYEGTDQLAFIENSTIKFVFDLENERLNSSMIAYFHLPDDYPSTESEVIVEIKESFGEPKWLTTNLRSQIKDGLKEVCDMSGGDQVLLFDYIEFLRPFLSEKWNEYVQMVVENSSFRSGNLQDRNLDLNSGINTEIEQIVGDSDQISPQVHATKNLIEIVSSVEPIVDRKSVFVAHLSKISSAEDVKLMMEILMENTRIRRATHNMLAYRLVKTVPATTKSSQNGEIMIQDCEDDGEKGAGSCLLRLLEICNCKNVAVVVSRWYGGIQLGPDRFKHIQNSARDLLSKHGFISP